MMQKNVGNRILNFGPWPEKNGPKGRAGWPGDKNFGIWTLGTWSFYPILLGMHPACFPTWQ